MPAARADSLPPCGTPTVSAPAYAAGSTNTITWTLSGTVGAGFIVEVALTPDFAQPEQSVGNLAASADSYTFAGLSDAQHYYHVRTKALSGICTASQWSVPVSTIQDATPPV